MNRPALSFFLHESTQEDYRATRHDYDDQE